MGIYRRVMLLAATLVAVAACGAGELLPRPASFAPLASPAAPGASSAASAVASAAPTPSPTSAAGTAVAVLDGLRAVAAGEATTYRVTLSGDSRHTTDILDVKGTIDMAGDDAALAVTFAFPREGTGRADYRRVGDEDWVRFDRGRWRSVTGLTPAQILDPLGGATDGSRMQYLGRVEGEDGLHQVQLTGLYLHPMLIPAANLTSEKVTKTKLLLVTDGTGVPVRATWTMRGQGRVSGQLQAIAIDLTLTWSKIGEPLTIKAP